MRLEFLIRPTRRRRGISVTGFRGRMHYWRADFACDDLSLRASSARIDRRVIGPQICGSGDARRMSSHVWRLRASSAWSTLTNVFWSSDTVVMMTFAVIVGVGAGLGAIIFVRLIAFFNSLFFGTAGSALGFMGVAYVYSCLRSAACSLDQSSISSRRRSRGTASRRC
jgi:hypothetical protein